MPFLFTTSADGTSVAKNETPKKGEGVEKEESKKKRRRKGEEKRSDQMEPKNGWNRCRV